MLSSILGFSVMLRKRSDERARQERGQQRALLLFAAALLVLIGFCAVAGWQMLVRPPRLLAAGAVADSIAEQPRRFSVPKLRVSELIPKGDSINTEDVIYVRRDGAASRAVGAETAAARCADDGLGRATRAST